MYERVKGFLLLKFLCFEMISFLNEEIEEEEDKSLKVIYELELRSINYFRNQDFTRAARYLLAALSIVMPSMEECRLRLRLGLLLLNYSSSATSLEFCIEQLQKAYRLSLRQPQQLGLKCVLALGGALERNKNYQLALNIYEEQLKKFENLPKDWLETFVICKARLLLLFGMADRAREFLDRASSYLKDFDSFYLKSFAYCFLDPPILENPTHNPISLVKQVIYFMKAGQYFQIEEPFKNLLKCKELNASNHLVILDNPPFNQLIRLFSIIYASLDGKQELSTLINALETISDPRFISLREKFKTLFISYQQNKSESSSLDDPDIEAAVREYEADSPLHVIKSHLLNALKKINVTTQCGNRKALIFLLLAWLYCQSDFEMALKMAQSAGMIGELRGNKCTVMLAHGILAKLYSLKGMPKEAKYHQQQQHDCKVQVNWQ
jgi:tetratricopeptide (TPR) repeat protein